MPGGGGVGNLIIGGGGPGGKGGISPESSSSTALSLLTLPSFLSFLLSFLENCSSFLFLCSDTELSTIPFCSLNGNSGPEHKTNKKNP